MSIGKVEVTGIKEFQAALRQMDTALPKQVRLVLNAAVGVVIDEATPHIPNRTGRARQSVKARSSQREARIAVGGKRAPYYPWLDFGGQGRHKGRPSARPFLKKGRYLYPALDRKRDRVTEIMAEGLAELAKNAGLEVT